MSEPVGWDVTMRPGNSIVLAAMLCLMAAGWLLRVSPVQRRQLVGLGLLGAALIGATQAIAWRAPRTAQVVGDWLPCLLMLIVYWQAGRFLGTPGSPIKSCKRGWCRSTADGSARCSIAGSTDGAAPGLEASSNWRTCCVIH